MDALRILTKTDKGREEVATRVHHLGPRERAVLILVDGKTQSGQLVERLRHIANAAEILDQLLQDAFVEAAGETPAPAGDAAPAKVATTPMDAEALAAVRYARRFILDTLGPGGDSLAEQLEGCRSRQELMTLLEKCREFLKLAASRRKADEFWSGLGGFTGGQ